MDSTINLTFRQLEQLQDIQIQTDAPSSALGDWYLSVRDKPISQFSDFDFGRAIRQEVFLEHVAPVLMERLRSDPLEAGSAYDGELLVALAGLPEAFWKDNAELKASLQLLICSISAQAESDDVAKALRTLRGI